MVKKQQYLTDSQLEGVREVVNTLMKKGIVGTLKEDAIKNLHEPLEDNIYLKEVYMSPEQAWATAVVSRLVAAGYTITKKEG